MHQTFRFSSAALLGFIVLFAGQAAWSAPIRDVVEQIVEEEEIPGAVVLVSGPKGRQLVATGLSNIKSKTPMRPNHRFYVASSGKVLTAVAALQLVQEGKMGLKDPVYRYMKEAPRIKQLPNIKQATVEQLLKHRSGFPEYYGDEFAELEAQNPKKKFTAAESLVYAVEQEAEFKAGTEFNYNNTNYVVLGELIAKLDQESYAQSIARRILKPVGMESSSIGAQGDVSLRARAYIADDDGELQDVSTPGWNATTGDGGLMSTAEDYEKFLFALFRDQTLLGKPWVQDMCKPQREDPDAEYGMGCMIQQTDWGVAWGHNGYIEGYNTETWYLPKYKTVFIFLANGDYLSDEPDLLNRVMKKYMR